MKLNFADLKYQLHVQEDCDVRPCPVGGHNVHGRLERKIQDIKKSIDKIISNERLSILELETLGSEISDTINDLSIGLGIKGANLELLLLLKLGQNNDCSPVGPLEVTCDINKFLSTNQKIFDAWFECWLVSSVPTFIKPKWLKRIGTSTKVALLIFQRKKKLYLVDNSTE